MGCVVALKQAGHYMAMFHDDGRFFKKDGVKKDPVEFILYKTLSTDGGLTWSGRYPCLVSSPHGPIALSNGTLLYAGKRLGVRIRHNCRQLFRI